MLKNKLKLPPLLVLKFEINMVHHNIFSNSFDFSSKKNLLCNIKFIIIFTKSLPLITDYGL